MEFCDAQDVALHVCFSWNSEKIYFSSSNIFLQLFFPNLDRGGRCNVDPDPPLGFKLMCELRMLITKTNLFGVLVVVT